MKTIALYATLAFTFVLTLAFTPAPARADSVSLQSYGESTLVTIGFQRGSALGERVFDVLSHTPLLKEVEAYAKPKTAYTGEGISIVLDDHSITLRLQLTASEARRFASSGSTHGEAYFQGESAAGPIRELHRAIQASTSRHALKSNSPSLRIALYGDEVAVLETDTFAGDSLHCVPNHDNAKYSLCSITVKGGR